MSDTIVKRCSCCKQTFTLAQWGQLKKVGEQCFADVDGGPDYEIRDCTCTNTLYLQKTCDHDWSKLAPEAA